MLDREPAVAAGPATSAVMAGVPGTLLRTTAAEDGRRDERGVGAAEAPPGVRREERPGVLPGVLPGVSRRGVKDE